MKAKVLVDYTTPGGLTSIALSQVQALLGFTDDVEFLGPAPVRVKIPKGAKFRPTYVPETIRNPLGAVRGLASIRRATDEMRGLDILISHGLRSSFLALQSGFAGRQISIYHGPESSDRLRGRIINHVAIKSNMAISVAPQKNPQWNVVYELSPSCAKYPIGQPREMVGKLRVGWLTRLEKPKRPDVWFHILRAAQREAVVEGVVFGEGPLLNELRQMSIEFGVDLTFGGFSDPKDGFAAMDISLFWSDSEGMPLAIQEAIWFGVPVITNRLPGIEAFLGENMVGIVDSREEATNLIIKMQDPKFFAHVITQQQNRLTEVMKRPGMNDLIMQFVKEMQ
jgi:glycosyltransferase involved in cell wall biosynthesis